MADIKTTLDNIVAHWALEESSGTRVDSHTAGHDLTDNNTVGTATGKQGEAADFESGNSEYLSLADHADFDFTDEFSISLWFKPESLATTLNNQSIIYKGNLGGDGNGGYRITYYNASGNKLLVQIWDSSNTDEQWRTTNNVIETADTWYHIVITVDASTSTCTIYVDGSSEAVTNIGSTATSIGANSGDVYIGARDAGQYIDGVFDEFTITSDVITSGEVTTIYNSGSGIPYEEAGGAATPPSTLLTLGVG
jgi:hypothetical protein